MLSIIIFLPIALIFALAVWLTYRSGAKSNGNMLLALTIPAEHHKHEEVKSILQAYKKKCNLFFLCLLVLSAPFVLFPYDSFVLIYLTLYMFGAVPIEIILRRHQDELRELKRKYGWWVGTPRMISIDLEVSRLKDTFPVSKAWWILPVVITAASTFLLYVTGNDMLPALWGVNGVVVLSFFVASLPFERAKTVVYSENSDINLAVNRLYKREWSKCFIIAATLHSIVFTFLIWLMNTQNTENYVIISLAVWLPLLIFVPIFTTHSKIKTTRNNLIKNQDSNVLTDDDIHWRGGFYNNPDDTGWFAEKRFGIGMTLNMGKKGAKGLLYGTLGGTALLMLGVGILMIPGDFGGMNFEVNEQTVQLSGPPFSRLSFDVGEIINITQIESLPSRTRLAGTSTNRIQTGRFNVSDYGISRLFVHRDSSPIIVIELENMFVFLSLPESSDTLEFYGTLENTRHHQEVK